MAFSWNHLSSSFKKATGVLPARPEQHRVEFTSGLPSASKLTGDVTQIVAQLPPVIESLTGIKFEKLLEQVPGLKKVAEKTDAGDKK